MSKLVNKLLVASTCALAVTVVPAFAFAHGGAEESALKDKTEGARPEADHEATGAEHEEEETKLALGIDMVIGFGKTPVVTSLLPGGANPTIPENVIDSSQVTTESFLLGGSYEIGHGFAAGLRLPFAIGTFSPAGRQTRSTSSLGNLELEGEYEMHLNEQMKLMFALGVALPTAQGDEVPTQEELDKTSSGKIIAQNNFDRFAINRAAASSRGFEENALFEPARLGFIPKVGLDYKLQNLMIQPYVKLENLISTSSGEVEHKYIGELVFGTFIGYAVIPYLDVGARVWGNVSIAGGDDAVAVVEPQLRGHIGSVMPVIGGIIPVAGPLTEPRFGGLRLAVAARF